MFSDRERERGEKIKKMRKTSISWGHIHCFSEENELKHHVISKGLLMKCFNVKNTNRYRSNEFIILSIFAILHLSRMLSVVSQMALSTIIMNK